MSLFYINNHVIDKQCWELKAGDIRLITPSKPNHHCFDKKIQIKIQIKIIFDIKVQVTYINFETEI